MVYDMVGQTAYVAVEK